MKCKLEDVSRVLKEYNFDLTAQNIGLICAKFNEPTVYEKKSAPGQELVIKTKKKPLPLWNFNGGPWDLQAYSPKNPGFTLKMKILRK